MDFSDNEHNLAELIFRGATELDLERTCAEELSTALTAWNHRSDQQRPGAELFRLDSCTSFTITYDGKAGEYWPNRSENDITETLVREFLYRNGLCTLSDYRPRLYRVKYTLIALDDQEYLLICPYLSAAGNIFGIVVVCATKMIRKH